MHLFTQILYHSVAYNYPLQIYLYFFAFCLCKNILHIISRTDFCSQSNLGISRDNKLCIVPVVDVGMAGSDSNVIGLTVCNTIMYVLWPALVV